MYKIAAEKENDDDEERERVREEKHNERKTDRDKNWIIDVGVEKMNDFHSNKIKTLRTNVEILLYSVKKALLLCWTHTERESKREQEWNWGKNEKMRHTSTRFQCEWFYSFPFFLFMALCVFFSPVDFEHLIKRFGWRKSNQRAKRYETKKIAIGMHKFLKFCCSSFVISQTREKRKMLAKCR